jgi:hypothetical protein
MAHVPPGITVKEVQQLPTKPSLNLDIIPRLVHQNRKHVNRDFIIQSRNKVSVAHAKLASFVQTIK